MIQKSTSKANKAKLRHLVDIRDCIEYMQERVRLADLAEVAVIEKNLSYAKKKEEELCKQIGYGDSINLSTTSQHLEGKA